jgi:hypothetical protein
VNCAATATFLTIVKVLVFAMGNIGVHFSRIGLTIKVPYFSGSG